MKCAGCPSPAEVHCRFKYKAAAPTWPVATGNYCAACYQKVIGNGYIILTAYWGPTLPPTPQTEVTQPTGVPVAPAPTQCTCPPYTTNCTCEGGKAELAAERARNKKPNKGSNNV